MIKIFITALTVCALVHASLVLADEWPQYRGLRGEGVSHETITNTDWAAKPPKILWKTPTPLGFSSFAVANGQAFTVIAREAANGEKREHCLALDAQTGKVLWSVALGESDYGHDGGNAGAPGNRGGDGPRSTPATDGEHVYVYDSHMLLSCLNAESGELIWKQDILKNFAGREIKWRNATSPLLVDETVYVAGGGQGETFLAFHKQTGKLIWKNGDETITHATPRFTTIGEAPQVIFFVQSGLVSLNVAHGKELWRTDFPFRVSSAASPVVDENLIYCSAGYSVGSQLIKVSEKQEPEKLWFKPNRLMNHWSTPIAYEGHLYGLYEFKKYGKAPLQCVEMVTGEIKWSERGFGPGNCILVGNKLVVLSDTGEVVLTDASPEKYNELGRIKAVQGKCWSTPAYSDGRIYVRSTEEAACLVVD